METLTAEHNGDRTIVRLNRPQTLNSIDQAMVDDLHEVCDQLEREPRILILTGARTDKGGSCATGAVMTPCAGSTRASSRGSLPCRCR